MRILLGSFEIGRQVYDLAEGFRKLGHEAETAMAALSPFHPDLQYTHAISQGQLLQAADQVQKRPLGSFLDPSEELVRLRHLLTAYDVYVFNFGNSLLPGNQDLPILRALGKRVVMLFQGSDVRHWSAAEPVAEAYGYALPPMYREAPYNDLAARLYALRMAERYADAIFSLPFQSELALRPYDHIRLAMDLSLYREHVPDREVPLLVHAPSRRGFKGTAEFFAALDRLRDEGVPFELRLLEKVPNREVIDAITDADVVLDELNAPHYGILSLESMASGCAVVAGCDTGYVPYQAGSPVFATRRTDVYERLKELLTNRTLRTRLARRGRAFVEAHHDHAGVAQHILDRLADPARRPDYYPSYAARHHEPPAGTDVPAAIRTLTAQVVQAWGLPAGATVDALAERGHLDPEALDPTRPVVQWRPCADAEREEAWGWAPAPAEAAGAADAAAHVIEHVRAALVPAALGGSVSPEALEQCMAVGAAAPEALEDPAALVALARLARELENIPAAEALLRKAAAAHAQASTSGAAAERAGPSPSGDGAVAPSDVAVVAT